MIRLKESGNRNNYGTQRKTKEEKKPGGPELVTWTFQAILVTLLKSFHDNCFVRIVVRYDSDMVVVVVVVVGWAWLCWWWQHMGAKEVGCNGSDVCNKVVVALAGAGLKLLLRGGGGGGGD
ncbi:hypothetical protein OIU85_004532 [Salix viminalis]|uniref:Transmembrane protein n=1 Tax=Salix viminalis TaxID=40686 RepID=A0A9Q0PT08_SALVM|nr:hypothetical protein OIU85_004532 [Salix viminalis]